MPAGNLVVNESSDFSLWEIFLNLLMGYARHASGTPTKKTERRDRSDSSIQESIKQSMEKKIGNGVSPSIYLSQMDEVW